MLRFAEDGSVNIKVIDFGLAKAVCVLYRRDPFAPGPKPGLTNAIGNFAYLLLARAQSKLLGCLALKTQARQK